MSWFKIDDGWWSHPKTLQLSDAAIALWARAGSWSCQHLTDGLIPAKTVELLGGKHRVVAELLQVSYWVKTDEGFQFHDWDQYQEKSEDVRDRRERARERMRAVRANKTGTRSERSQEVRSTPTRPDPTIESNDSIGAAKRATKIPAGFTITESMQAWAKEKTPLVDIQAETENFKNHHEAKGSTFKSWEAAWRTWMGKSNGYLLQRQPALRMVSGMSEEERRKREANPWMYQ